jgi:hypothetical protein
MVRLACTAGRFGSSGRSSRSARQSTIRWSLVRSSPGTAHASAYSSRTFLQAIATGTGIAAARDAIPSLPGYTRTDRSRMADASRRVAAEASARSTARRADSLSWATVRPAARDSNCFSTRARTSSSANGAGISTSIRACAGEMVASSNAARVAGSCCTSVIDSASSRDAASLDRPRASIASSTAHSLTVVSTAGREAREAAAAAPTSSSRRSRIAAGRCAAKDASSRA